MSVYLAYLCVGVLWGCTNPFIKAAQESVAEDRGVNDPNDKQAKEATCESGPFEARSFMRKLFSSCYENLRGLFMNPRLFLPFAINQAGSLAFYALLSQEPVSRASPICNSLTFLFTALTGRQNI
jgi:drug/metabolite transporter (DMT)-like permease